jgi:hypothetical protein
MALFRKTTAVLIVDRVEPVLPFWSKLGITPGVQVPDEAAKTGAWHSSFSARRGSR